ncbi:putative LLM family oxidoreductase [Arthrobacter sp. SLBN-100]|uniref:LLM class flavin-dependent oxidoreductase n=1 Tax=Arthrobacter sp. SLBN-100 TaxID=2768450 RepID=UPI001150D7A8|nr:LLM class flavin-dependent oxidoreductase [Arthrobacter sp. SLBN-100]TQJ62210.1 putative LLM family oxidoreductase [Arthrobacter sp. SLBN-100]
MELGIYTFGEINQHPDGNATTDVTKRLDQLVELARNADQGGLDVIALGEHHRPDFALSAPEVVLAAMAAVTKRIRLTSGVTVLSSQDPVRVYQQYATLDHLSHGRAEIIAGRGAFTESFPLFGYDLADYDELFDEKLRMLLQIREQETLTWHGRHRPRLDHAHIAPRALQNPLPVWVGIGGTPSSAMRAGALGLPMVMGFFTGTEEFIPRVELYLRAAEQAGHDAAGLRLGASGHMFIGKTSQGARDAFYPYYAEYLRQMGITVCGTFPRQAYEQWIQRGLPVGSPQQVTEEILKRVELLGIDRFLGQIDVGNLPPAMINESLELFITEVLPVLKRETATATPAPR